MTTIRFCDLYDRLTGTGLRVGIERNCDGHELTITDPAGPRVIHYPVSDADFDRAATTLVLSALLRERLTTPAALNARTQSGRLIVIGRWPELEALWRPATSTETH